MRLLPIAEAIALEGEPLSGASPSEIEIIQNLVKETGKAVCAVTAWVIIDVIDTNSAPILASGKQPTRGLAVLDAPLPGTAAFDRVSLDDRRVWHFHFHQAPDIPESLTAEKEAYYLERFGHDLAYNAGAIDEVTKASYVSSFSGHGGMRVGFELYRSFAADADFYRAQLAAHGKTKIPVLALAGESSAFSTIMKPMMEEVTEKVSFVVISNAGHWLAEENPSAVAQAMFNFDDSNLGHDT